MTTTWTFEPSYYEASVTRPPLTDALAGDVDADICVIGGGFTGVSSALTLAQRGRKVVLLESRAIGWGASGRNGGQMIHDFATDDLTAVARSGGVSEKQLFDLSLEALELVEQNITEHNIACDFQRGYAEAAVKPAHLRDLQEWAEIVERDYHYSGNTVLDAVGFREVVASRAYCGGLLNDRSGHLHPLKYVLGLAAAAKAAGVAVYENTSALRIDEGKDGITVHTANGRVRCRRLLVAGNAYLEGLQLPVAGHIMPVGTYIGATHPLGDEADSLIRDNRGVCNTNFVLDYFRLSADQRLLFGGRVSYSGRTPANLNASLRARMLSVFPQLEHAQFEYLWGGYVAITINRFPDVGRIGDSIYYAQGFSGHGVALSGYCGKLIAEAICGEEEKFAIFDRVKHHSFPGGKLLRTPLLVLAMLYYRLRDLI